MSKPRINARLINGVLVKRNADKPRFWDTIHPVTQKPNFTGTLAEIRFALAKKERF